MQLNVKSPDAFLSMLYNREGYLFPGPRIRSRAGREGEETNRHTLTRSWCPRDVLRKKSKNQPRLNSHPLPPPHIAVSIFIGHKKFLDHSYYEPGSQHRNSSNSFPYLTLSAFLHIEAASEEYIINGRGAYSQYFFIWR